VRVYVACLSGTESRGDVKIDKAIDKNEILLGRVIGFIHRTPACRLVTLVIITLVQLYMYITRTMDYTYSIIVYSVRAFTASDGP